MWKIPHFFSILTVTFTILTSPDNKLTNSLSDYLATEDGVKTDVVIFNREDSSEYQSEREEMKDELLAWKQRYKKRTESKKT